MTINEIFLEATAKKASDVHLVTGLLAFFRIDGELKKQDKWPAFERDAILSLIKSMLGEEKKREYFAKKELDLSYQIENSVRFRVNLFWEKGNPVLAARIIPAKIPTMEDVDMPKAAYKLVKLNQGLIIVTGPTGCGKSTTLAAMINYINENKAHHIITLEDPIEFVFTPKKSIIVQRELGRDMVSFGAALKHIVRQDPNIIMVGEMRDLETIALAITLAETGHLILATLHTPNVSQTIDRIIDIFPPYQQTQIRLQVSSSLKGIIAQRLLPREGGGRVAARELLTQTPAISSLIRENKLAQIKSCIQTGAKEGMFTLEQDLKRLYQAKIISLETALAQTTDKEALLKG